MLGPVLRLQVLGLFAHMQRSQVDTRRHLPHAVILSAAKASPEADDTGSAHAAALAHLRDGLTEQALIWDSGKLATRLRNMVDNSAITYAAMCVVECPELLHIPGLLLKLFCAADDTSKIAADMSFGKGPARGHAAASDMLTAAIVLQAQGALRWTDPSTQNDHAQRVRRSACDYSACDVKPSHRGMQRICRSPLT